MSRALDAMQIAMELHANQKRKYTGAPYTTHLAEVAGITASVMTDDVPIAVAWLHDSMEDQDLSLDYLVRYFGHTVAHGVKLLSDLEQGNRETRKRLSRERLAQAPDWIQTIKCADIISNTCSIVQLDPQFAKVYLPEKKLLLDVLDKADANLRCLAYQQL